MWTSQGDGKKFRVIHVMDDSVHIYNSDPSKLSLRYVHRHPIVKLKFQPQDPNGYLVYEKDSLGIKTYLRIDFLGLDIDSVTLAEREQIFNDLASAENQAGKLTTEGKFFYTTEYFYYLKMARSAPDLKKEEYIGFLKTINEELKKPEIKAKAIGVAGKTTEQKMDNYFRLRIRQAPFSGKIYPGNLAKASKKFAGDESVKKLMGGIRPVFFVKPVDPQQKSKDSKSAPVAAGKEDKKAGNKSPGKGGTEVKIQTN